MIRMKIDCNVPKANIEKAYENYNKEIQTDLMRISGIDPTERNSLWKLWILAIMYQAMREETSEKTFRGIPRNGLVLAR
jgi:hypothetical protein